MPIGVRIQRFSVANENFQKFDLNIFALGQRLSGGIRGFGNCSGELEIYLKMHFKSYLPKSSDSSDYDPKDFEKIQFFEDPLIFPEGQL